jgi:hypothetical protein
MPMATVATAVTVNPGSRVRRRMASPSSEMRLVIESAPALERRWAAPHAPAHAARTARRVPIAAGSSQVLRTQRNYACAWLPRQVSRLSASRTSIPGIEQTCGHPVCRLMRSGHGGPGGTGNCERRCGDSWIPRGGPAIAALRRRGLPPLRPQHGRSCVILRQHEPRVRGTDAQLDPPLAAIERLIGEDAEAHAPGPEGERAILIGGGDADELDVCNHATS